MKKASIGRYILLSQIYVLITVVIVPYMLSGKKIAVIDNTVNDAKSITVSAEENETPSKEYKVGDMDIEEYIKGVLAAEMPVSFPPEALKAQAVAARTYAVRTIDNADFPLNTDDIGQAFITKETMLKNWGDNYDAYYKKISDAVDSTKGEVMEYNGEPILAVFHSTSAGETETAGNIWNYDLPYLVSAESEGDTYAPGYEVSAVFTPSDIIAKIKEKYPEFSAEENGLFKSIVINSRSDAGYVTSVAVGNMSFTGKQLREALGLRSANFTVEDDNGSIVFITKGFGHGAGMSQYGAKYMAENGSDYKQILNHYYKDITIAKL